MPRSTYLRTAGCRARIARSGAAVAALRILGALPAMASKATPAQPGQPGETLRDTMDQRRLDVEANPAVQAVQSNVSPSYLDDLYRLRTIASRLRGLGAKGSADQLLERQALSQPSAGKECVFRAASVPTICYSWPRVILLQSHPDQVPFLLLEEPEAHRPQHQTLFMQVLERRAAPYCGGRTANKFRFCSFCTACCRADLDNGDGARV